MDVTRPTIPPEEYPRRWRRVQAVMAAEGLDLLVAYGNDRAVSGPAHVRWLADVPVHFEPMAVLMPPSGDPVLACGPESDQYALRVGRIPDVRVLREFTHPDEDYPFSEIEALADIATGSGGLVGPVRRLGVAGRGLLDAATAAALAAALPDAEWVDVEQAMCGLRAVKSPAELAVIRHAYHLADIGLMAASAAIHPGVTERAVAAEAEAAMRRAGAEGTGIDTIVGSGPNARPILARHTFREIEGDDLVVLTMAPRYQGYHGAIGRPVFVGEPGREARRAFDAARRAQDACSSLIRPGIEGWRVEAAGRRIMEDAGFGSFFLYSGVHSIGVIEFEPPIFGPSAKGVMEEGMVFSVDIPVFNAPWGGLRLEDGFVVTASGAERLNDTPYLLRA